MKSLKAVALLLAGITFGASLFSPNQARSASIEKRTAPATRRDGNWWRAQDEHSKIDYVLGFVDGAELGFQLTFYTIDASQKSVKCAGAASQSYNAQADKFLSQVTVGQIKDGLNDLYEDYRNRRIETARSVWIVLNGIAGMPRAEMEKMIELDRKFASQ